MARYSIASREMLFAKSYLLKIWVKIFVEM